MRASLIGQKGYSVETPAAVTYGRVVRRCWSFAKRLGRWDRRAVTDLRSRDPLVKGHIFATQLHIQRAADLIAVDLPLGTAGGSLWTYAAQHVGNRFIAMLLMFEMTSLKRLVFEHRERESIEACQA